MGAHTPWPSDFSELKKLEDILQCPICYEFIDTCMITSCSHNFCSLCIRKYLQFKTQCPTCFEETHSSELRKNRPLDDIVTIYVKLKDRLLFTLRLVTMTQSVKTESKVNGIDSPGVSPEKEKTSKSVKKETKTPKNVKNRKSVVQKLFSEKKISPENEEAKPIVLDGVVIPSMFQPHKSPKKCAAKRPEDMSACPVCSVDVPFKNLNLHLDSCLAASDPDSARLKRKPEKRDPIPKRVYTMMKDKEIKKYLKDYGLSTGGDKKAMISRISRYVVLYNAECDKEYPRPVAELIKQVEREEKDEKTTSSNPLFQSARPPTIPPEKKKDPETIEKLNKEYLDLNKENFKKLIEAMKQRDGKNIKPLKPMNRIESDDENEIKPAPLLDQPSTSKQNIGEEVISVYSQATIVDSDSDPDIIDTTPVKVEVDVHECKKIDLDKTEEMEEEEEECEIVEVQDKNATIVTIDEESDSYESVFNTSTKSELAKTPTNKLSMSARKKQKAKKVTPNKSPSTSKLGERLDEIFNETEDDGKGETAKLTNGTCHDVSEEDEDDDDIEDEEDEEDDEEEEEEEDSEEDDEVSALKTPVRKSRSSPQVSPMKTRSAKRKSQTRSDEEKSAGKTTRRKRVKPSVSPDRRSVSPEF